MTINRKLFCMKEQQAAELAYVYFIAASSRQLLLYSKCSVVVLYKLAGCGQRTHNPAHLETQRSTSLIISYNRTGQLSRYSDWLRAGRFGIESQWGRDFPPVQKGPGAHPASCKMDNGSFLGVKSGRGVLLTTHPLLVPRLWKTRAIPLPILWATPGL